jgi:hypothetical protein
MKSEEMKKPFLNSSFEIRNSKFNPLVCAPAHFPSAGPDRCMPVAQEAFPMSRVDPIDEPRTVQEHRELQPNPRKIAHTPDQAEGDERTVDEAFRNQEQDRGD